VEKKSVKTNNGVLEFTILDQGKLILAEVTEGYVKKAEIRAALYQAGLPACILEANLQFIEDGLKGQCPVAQAMIIPQPADLWFHFEKPVTEATHLEAVHSGKTPALDIMNPVRVNDRLVSMFTPAQTMLGYPDGRRELIRNREMDSIQLYRGANVQVQEDGKTLYSLIDGYAHRDMYGKVSVYPVDSVRNISRAHGSLRMDVALLVDGDVNRDSEVILPSNIHIKGMIKSATVMADGNLQVDSGLDNTLSNEICKVTSGQSLVTLHIRGYRVFSGGNILVRDKIENSNIQCMDSLSASIIAGSEIRVRNKVFVNDITHNTQIYIGPTFTEEPRIKEYRQFHQQHEKRKIDLEWELEDARTNIDQERQNLVSQLARLKKLSVSTGNFVVINRINQNLLQLSQKMEDLMGKYRQILRLYEEEEIQLAFYDQHANLDMEAEVHVLGEISTGSSVISRNQVMKIGKPLRQVIIRVDKFFGTLQVLPYSGN